MMIFKTKEFSRLACKERIADLQLSEAIERADKGLVDASIGKFLIKQRIARRNEGRSGGFRAIIFYRQRDRAVFLHLFAKNDKGNLTEPELVAYREFAKHLANLTAEQVKHLVDERKWIEIDNEDDEKKVS
jgi:hypothetical protein